MKKNIENDFLFCVGLVKRFFNRISHQADEGKKKEWAEDLQLCWKKDCSKWGEEELRRQFEKACLGSSNFPNWYKIEEQLVAAYKQTHEFDKKKSKLTNDHKRMKAANTVYNYRLLVDMVTEGMIFNSENQYQYFGPVTRLLVHLDPILPQYVQHKIEAMERLRKSLIDHKTDNPLSLAGSMLSIKSIAQEKKELERPTEEREFVQVVNQIVSDLHKERELVKEKIREFSRKDYEKAGKSYSDEGYVKFKQEQIDSGLVLSSDKMKATA